MSSWIVVRFVSAEPGQELLSGHFLLRVTNLEGTLEPSTGSIPFHFIDDGTEPQRQSLGSLENNSFIALPGKGGHGGLVPSKLCSPGRGSEVTFPGQGAGRGQRADLLLIGGW